MPTPSKQDGINPPDGYSLVPRDSSVPSFIREAVGPVKEKMSHPSPSSYSSGVKTIASSVPGTISVYDAASYTPEVRNHEMTHQFQATRANGNIPMPFGYELPIASSSPAAPMAFARGSVANYDYGGEAGLKALRNAHKTAADLNPEQQADMVADYKAKQDAYLAKVKSGKATPADLRQMYETHQAYHPFVQQVADVPSRFRDTLPSLKTLLGIGKPEPLAPAPAPPGLPSYDTAGLGVAPADPLLGGQSQPIHRASSVKIGTIKQFPNGKTGKWDGHGWEVQR